MDYDKMLNKVYETLPKKTLNLTRFKMPEVDSFIQGKKTIVRGFVKIIKNLKRNETDAMKFFTKETGRAATIDADNLVLNGKLGRIEIQKALESYIKKFVLCEVCNRPDTKMIDQKGVKMLKCEACGAASPIRD